MRPKLVDFYDIACHTCHTNRAILRRSMSLFPFGGTVLQSGPRLFRLDSQQRVRAHAGSNTSTVRQACGCVLMRTCVCAGQDRQRGQCEVDDGAESAVGDGDDCWHQRHTRATLHRKYANVHGLGVRGSDGRALRVALRASRPFL